MKHISKGRLACAAVAAVLLLGLFVFAAAVPQVVADPLYADAPPALFGGQVRITLNARSLSYYRGMAVTRTDGSTAAAVVQAREYADGAGNTVYDVTLDGRYAVGFVYRDVTPAVYEQAAAQGLLYPVFDVQAMDDPTAAVNANVPHTEADYLRDEAGQPLLYTSSAHGALRRVRVFYADWYAWQNGRAPVFLLGTDNAGNDCAAGIAAALKTGFAVALCAAAAAFAAGWIYGALFGRVRRFGWVLDVVACLGSAAFAALCARYLPSRIGETAALICALAGLCWLWAAHRCRRAQGKKWRAAAAAAVQALPCTLLLGAVLTGAGVFDAPGFGPLLISGTDSAPHALWLPVVFFLLLVAAFGLLGLALQPKKNR